MSIPPVERRSAAAACTFCGGPLRFLYRLGAFNVRGCRSCHTIGLDQLPGDEELRSYYQGFRFQADMAHLSRIRTPEMQRWMESLHSARPGRMLDIGGGGGFFARAFEDFRLGESTYVDLDEHACDFAREQVGIQRVFAGSLEKFKTCHPMETFDFIYCRHVIEHLPDPVSLLHACPPLLKPGGTLVIQCPNGRSREFAFLHPGRWLHGVRTLAQSNGIGLFRAYARSLLRPYGFGLDPIRHLWAITDDGIRAVYGKLPGFQLSIHCSSQTDTVFSPYHHSQSCPGRIRDAAGRLLFNHLLRGAHLIAVLRRLPE